MFDASGADENYFEQFWVSGQEVVYHNRSLTQNYPESHSETALNSSLNFENVYSSWGCVDFRNIPHDMFVPLEPCRFTVILCFVMRKPFDVLVEGCLLKESGEDRTPFELFVAGVRGWKADLRRRLGERMSNGNP